MTSSNATAKKVEGFRGFLQNISTDFHQTYVILGSHLQHLLRLKDGIQVIHCCHGNQLMRKCWAKNHDLGEEKWHFLKISN